MAQNEFRNALQAMSNSAASTVSAPVDGIAWLLRKAGVNIPGNALGGSDWMAQQGLTAPVRPGASQIAGDTLGLLAPMVAAAKAPQIARGLLQVGENALAPSVVNRGGAAGQRGIFMGDMSKTWDTAAAAKAQAMEQAGADARAIWQETGTFKGVDGKWRQEIDDSASMFRGFGATDSKSVGEAIHHPNAMKAYPELADMRAQSVPGSGGSFSGEMGYAPSGPTVNLGWDNGPDMQSVALHEIQHAVQGRQGFANGGRPFSGVVLEDPLLALDPVPRLLKELRSGPWTPEIGKEFKAIGDLPPGAFGRYHRLAGEAEARAVQKRMNLTQAERRALFPFDSYDVPVNSLIVR